MNTAMNCPVAENADLRLAGQQLTSHKGLCLMELTQSVTHFCEAFCLIILLYLFLNITPTTDEKSQQNVFANAGLVLRSFRHFNRDEFV